MFPSGNQYTYGTSQPPYSITTPGAMFQEPYETVDWNEYYVPTQRGGAARVHRPVIYVAAQLPPGNSFGGGVPRYF